jgi:hypothetical protein
MTRIVSLAALAILAAAPAIHAQQITCAPPGCVRKTADSTTAQFLVVRVTTGDQPRDHVPVTFDVKKGSGSVTPVVTTDPNGVAVTQWTPSASGAYPAEVQATATVGGRTVMQTIALSYAASPSSLSLAAVSGNDQWWYQNLQLRRPVRVAIVGAPSSSECEAATVIFRAVGGTAAPDTANGTWQSGGWPGCVAQSWWHLSNDVGTQALRATLPNGSNVTFRAHARELPRVVIGVAVDRKHSLWEAKTDTETIHVTHTTSGGAVAFDSLITTTKPSHTAAAWTFTPTVGVDFPIHPQVEPIRVSLLTTLKDPERNLFVGLSVPQLLRGVAQESVGFDFHLTMHVERVTTLKDPTACGLDPAKCDTRNPLRYSVGIVGIT